MTIPSRSIVCLLAVLVGLAAVSPADAQRKKVKRPPRKKKAGPTGARVLGRITGFPKWVTSAAISPDGKTAAAGSDGVVKLIDLPSRKERATLKTKPGYNKAVAFSPDGAILAVGGYESLQLWNPKTAKLIKTLDGHTGQVTGVSFSPDGKQLASCSHDETARVWDVQSGKELRKIGRFQYPVNGIAYSPDGKWLATAQGDEYRVTREGIINLWDAATGKEKTWITKDENGKPKILRLVVHEKAANSVAFSPDGKRLISTGFDEKVNVYDLTTGKALGYFDGHGRPTHDARFLPDGITVVSAAGGRAKKRYLVMVWSSKDGEKFATLEGHRGPVTCAAVSPDGKTIVSGAHDNTVILWDLSATISKIQKARREESEKAPKQKGEKENKSTSKAAGRTTPVSYIAEETKEKTLRIGIIGLDTSHVIAFTKTLNDKNAKPDVANCRVIVAYPKGSPDIESSTSRVPKYTAQMKEMGVEIVDSIPELIKRVDAVLLETNDGRPHLEQVLPVLRAGKPVFVDKPIAASLADAVAIFEAAKKYKTPIFSSSSLRYMPEAQAIRNGEIGKVQTAEAWSPCSLEKTHPDLFWYGIHGVEALFTVMGTGCKSVKRTISTPAMDEVQGIWSGGRKGTFSGYRSNEARGKRPAYGVVAKGAKGEKTARRFGGYRPLIVEFIKFFRTGKPPVSEAETLEIYAFMVAADESKRLGGKEVTLESVMARARKEAKKRLAKLDR